MPIIIYNQIIFTIVQDFAQLILKYMGNIGLVHCSSDKGVFYFLITCSQVAFQSSMREAMRLLTHHADQIQRGEASIDGEFHQTMHDALDHRVAVLLEKMTDSSKSECKRSGAWGVLGEGQFTYLQTDTAQSCNIFLFFFFYYLCI